VNTMAKKNHEVEMLEMQLTFLRKQLEEIKKDPGDTPVAGCGDNSCEVARIYGMGTNGGCRCSLQTFRRALRFEKRRSLFLTETIKALKYEVDKDGPT
jgi:hypothetical protein